MRARDSCVRCVCLVTMTTSSRLQDPAALDDEEEHKPIDLSWPDTTRKRIVYVLVAPIVFSLWITLPDCKSPRGR